MIVGVGAGGLAVAAAARGPDWPLGRLDVEEFDLPDALHPGGSYGAVGSTGRTLLGSPGLARLARDERQVRRAASEAETRLRAGPVSDGYPVAGMADRPVVLVDDGGSAPTKLAAALDFVRRDRPSAVVLAVACAPVERIAEMREFAGDVVVGFVPSWTEWFGWHGEMYDSDRLPSRSEVERLLGSAR